MTRSDKSQLNAIISFPPGTKPRQVRTRRRGRFGALGLGRGCAGINGCSDGPSLWVLFFFVVVVILNIGPADVLGAGRAAALGGIGGLGTLGRGAIDPNVHFTVFGGLGSLGRGDIALGRGGIRPNVLVLGGSVGLILILLGHGGINPIFVSRSVNGEIGP